MLRLNQCTGALDWQIAVSHVVYYVVPAACSLELLLDSYQPTKLFDGKVETEIHRVTKVRLWN